jgi:hypothetical protein
MTPLGQQTQAPLDRCCNSIVKSAVPSGILHPQAIDEPAANCMCDHGFGEDKLRAYVSALFVRAEE